MPSNALPLRLKQTFPPMIWIFTEAEGDEIESSLPFKIFSTLKHNGLELFLKEYSIIFKSLIKMSKLTINVIFTGKTLPSLFFVFPAL